MTLGDAQTISAPHMNAVMCKLLDLSPGLNVLEIGGGSGYRAALCRFLAGKHAETTGHIYTIERIPEFANSHRESDKVGLDAVVTVLCQDRTEGLPKFSPYDRILVTADCASVPLPLKKQLKVGGKIVIPVGARAFYQELLVLQKENRKSMGQVGDFWCCFCSSYR